MYEKTIRRHLRKLRRKGGDEMKSKKFTLNEADLKKWGYNFFRYVFIPTAAAFLGAYQLNLDAKYAWGVAVATVFNSCQNLFNLWRQGK